ncbi:hypothetical protein OHB00_49425 [Streptomyces sp. NBC_00631]|uniref:hypothetical protein n=1 Tax=Streptomyces sp. NBC_00631 TaxID=2975793 RepID=UPI0030E4420B
MRLGSAPKRHGNCATSQTAPAGGVPAFPLIAQHVRQQLTDMMQFPAEAVLGPQQQPALRGAFRQIGAY